MILLTGGSGALGSEIKKLMPDVWAPTHAEIDITKPLPKIEADLIIHCAAYTNVDAAEKYRGPCYETNVLGTRRLAETGIPIIYISTDSVFDGREGAYSEEDIPYPKNFYSVTKLLGESEVRKGVIIRCCHKRRPWVYEFACKDRFFTAQYSDETAQSVVKAVSMFRDLPRIINIGGVRRSHYEMAIETKPHVRPVLIDHYEVWRGRDTSLDCSLWESLTK